MQGEPRLLMVVPRFHGNIYFATKVLIDAGWHVSIYVETISQGEVRNREEHSLVVPEKFSLPQDFLKLTSSFRASKPDVIFLRRTKRLCWPVRALAYQKNIPVFSYNQRPFYSPLSLTEKAREILAGRPLRRVTPVLGLNRQSGPDPNATYLPWPVLRTQKCNFEIKKKDALQVLCVAKLAQERKNIIPLIEALTPLGEAGKVNLTIAGNTIGGEPVLLDKVRRLSLSHWIVLWENVPFKDMGSIYNGKDICILPSFSEQLGSSPLEAMPYGVIPFISCECGSAGYITHGENGYLFSPDNLAEPVRLMEELISEPRRLDFLKQKALDCAEVEFGAEAFMSRMNKLISSLH